MRKRGKRKPRVVFNDPLAIFRPLAKEKRDAVMTRYLSALESVATGSAPTVEELKDLSDVINVCETLVQSMGRMDGKEVGPLVEEGVEAIVEAAGRYRAGKAIRMSGKGLEAVRVLIDIYGQCLERLSEQEMTMATEITCRRLEQIQRQRRPSADVIQL
jgi:hypothetical protein